MTEKLKPCAGAKEIAAEIEDALRGCGKTVSYHKVQRWQKRIKALAELQTVCAGCSRALKRGLDPCWCDDCYGTRGPVHGAAVPDSLETDPDCEKPEQWETLHRLNRNLRESCSVRGAALERAESGRAEIERARDKFGADLDAAHARIAELEASLSTVTQSPGRLADAHAEAERLRAGIEEALRAPDRTWLIQRLRNLIGVRE